MKISVIIPTCHRNDLLAKCLDCLAPNVQTLPSDKYEVIVTDDGSKTTAEQMVREKYLWARWVEGPKCGPATNRNSGAKFANGEWLAFTDDDCLPEDDWLLFYYSAIRENVFVYEGKTLCSTSINSPMLEAPINLTGGQLYSCNFMVFKDIFFRLGGFDENFPFPAMEDWELNWRIRSNFLSVYFVKDARVNHPARSRYWGKSYARLYESHAYFWYKSGNSSSFRNKVLLHMLLGRLRFIFGFFPSIDGLSAFLSWIVEVLYSLRHVGIWEKKYYYDKSSLC